MFNNELLKDLPIQKDERTKNYSLRALELSDFNQLYPILKQLTKIGDPTLEKFTNRFNWMKKTGVYYVIVCYKNNKNELAGTATLIVEHKFIHECADRGRIEDVVVDVNHRGKALGKLLVESCTELSKRIGCYKTTLECSVENSGFYEKMGYKSSFEKYMVKRF